MPVITNAENSQGNIGWQGSIRVDAKNSAGWPSVPITVTADAAVVTLRIDGALVGRIPREQLAAWLEQPHADPYCCGNAVWRRDSGSIVLSIADDPYVVSSESTRDLIARI